MKRFGKINILINNAAIARGKLIKELQFEQFKKTMEINFLSIVQLDKLFLA